MKGNVYVKKIPYGKWDIRIFDLDRAQKMSIQSFKEYSFVLKNTINVKKHQQLFGNISQKLLKSDFNDEILLKASEEGELKYFILSDMNPQYDTFFIWNMCIEILKRKYNTFWTDQYVLSKVVKDGIKMKYRIHDNMFNKYLLIGSQLNNPPYNTQVNHPQVLSTLEILLLIFKRIQHHNRMHSEIYNMNNIFK